ncbi:hypothetical protein SRABI04_03075 [Chryseobacterium sp. Bi04]|nr:hypothetical protein SRABI04_03075 [Chryseobacterium sp. Bi04]
MNNKYQLHVLVYIIHRKTNIKNMVGHPGIFSSLVGIFVKIRDFTRLMYSYIFRSSRISGLSAVSDIFPVRANSAQSALTLFPFS